jgi:hypothetical protein
MKGLTRSRPAVPTATIFLGRTVDALAHAVGVRTRASCVIGSDLTAREKRERTFGNEKVLKVARKIRLEQAGKGGATVVNARGAYETFKPENSSVVTIKAATGESEAVFRRRIGELAERLACGLAQAEIIVEERVGARVSERRASPKGLPAPDAPGFERAVRDLGRRSGRVAR